MGTTAIAATLVNVHTDQRHALSWTDPNQPDLPPFFQLPAVAYFLDEPHRHQPALPDAVGYEALRSSALATSSGETTSGFLVHSFKPYLDGAIPYYSPQTQTWEPSIQRSEQDSVPLIWVQQTLVSLLSSLAQTSTAPAALNCHARGLAAPDFAIALETLAGVIISHPMGASEAYRFTLREAVLAAGLVAEAEQIFFLEEAVAALLAEFPPEPKSAELGSAIPPGYVLVVSAGAISTDLVLADLPAAAHTLARDNLHLRRLDYGGNALDQDIICQLLYPFATWEGLELESLDLPLPGEPDLETRDRLQQRLESSALGRSLLSSVRQTKPTLCQQDVSYLLDSQHWMLRYGDLQNWVILPYLQQLNRELNLLLNQAGIPATAVSRVVCTGGTATIPAIAQSLQQRFPHAHWVNDASPSGDPGTPRNRIAEGLTRLPYVANVLDRERHQRSDYFLLREILKLFPSLQMQPVAIAQILQQLKANGMSLQTTQPFLLNLLEGRLPMGLIPTAASRALFTPHSRQHPDYQALAEAPLFTRQENHRYTVNPEQRDRLWQYLEAILANTHQKLEKPLIASISLQPAP